MSRDIVLIDAKNLAYRSHYTHQNLNTKDGQSTSVIYGALSNFLYMARRASYIPMIWVWDGRGSTWRHALMKARSARRREKREEESREITKLEAKEERGYKGNRQRTDVHKSVNQQCNILHKFLQDTGIRSFCVKNVEADDMIGILSHHILKNTHFDRVLVCSNDKDFYQLMNKDIKIWAPQRGEKRPTIVTREDVIEKFGVVPEEWAKFRALMGDSGDNIQKIMFKVGPKTALKYLKEGLDASQEKFSNLPANVKVQFKQFEPIWQDIHDNYLLCKIIRKLNTSLIPQSIKSEIVEQLEWLDTKHCYVDKSKMHDAKPMVEFMLKYELDQLFGMREQFSRLV